ncbi:MAG: ABC transporter permease [Hyphomicrobiales bacterium]
MKRPAAAGRILGMLRKEFLQIFRDPRLSRIIFVAPLLQVVVFGYAVSTDVKETSTYVVDLDRSADSRALLDAFTASGYFRIVGRSDRPADLAKAMDHGRAILGLEIPPDFTERFRAGKGASVQIIIDGTQSNTATVARGYAERIIASFGQRALDRPAAGGVDLRERAWFNPELVSRNYNVPAVVGTLLMLVCLILTGLAVVRERELGTLEQLMVSPLRPAELIAGKTIPFAVIGLVDMALVVALALLWFHVPFRGSFLLLVGASLLYIVAALGIGLLVSTISATQQEAYMASILVFMPSVLLSGFMFPVTSMPELFQWITLANPVRHYIVIVRSVFLKGAGFEALWPHFLALFLIGATMLLVASTRFRKSIA